MNISCSLNKFLYEKFYIAIAPQKLILSAEEEAKSQLVHGI